MQAVYHLHTPEAAAMILAVKELVEVEYVSASAVRMVGQQRAERKTRAGLSWLDQDLCRCDWLRL
ncbi:hypothetical protein H4582DRAFT_1978907, partial [Lactarius indigo]